MQDIAQGLETSELNNKLEKVQALANQQAVERKNRLESLPVEMEDYKLQLLKLSEEETNQLSSAIYSL